MGEHPFHDDDEIEEAPYWIVRDEKGNIPTERYCYAHLIGESEYLEKHGLKHSDDIWVEPICCEEESGYEFGRCDDCEAAARSTAGERGETT